MTGSKAKLVEIDKQRAGQRIDNYLISYFSKVPKSRIYRALRSGEVRVNKKRVKPVYRIQTGDVVRIPPIQTDSTPNQQSIPKYKCEVLENSIIFEDENVMVLNKPSGIASHSGTNEKFGAIEILRASREHQPFLELAHRIDKETSGCLILAKNRRALLDVQQAIQADTSLKRYTLLVKGRWDVNNYVVTHSLLRTDAKNKNKKMLVDEDGQSAETVFSTIEFFKKYSLMKAEIHSGRTHQIRVHAQAEGFPIAGDSRYGDYENNRQLQNLGLKRMFLHASYLKLQLSDLSQKYEFQAPLDQELKQFIKHLKNDSSE